MIRSLAGCLFTLVLCPLSCLAQTSPPDTTFHVSSRIVYVDVVVRDRQGRVVHGLSQRDFRLAEDGAAQPIDYFDEQTYSLAAGHGAGTAPAGDSSATRTAASEFTNLPAADAASGSVSIVLFDLLNTATTGQEYARRQLLSFLESLPRGQKVALFVLAGRLQMVQSFTGSSDRLIDAARHIDPRNFGLIKSDAQSMQDVDLFAKFAIAVGAAGLLKSVEQAEADEKAGNEEVRARVTIAALAELARATNGYPGRKNLLWLAESFPLTVGAQLEETRIESRTNLSVPDARTTANLIADAQISVYPINLLGLDTASLGSNVSGASSVSPIGGPQGSTLTPQMGDTLQTQFNARAELRAQMEDLAYQTGGEPFSNTNDFARALRESMEDGSNYYTLAYRPANRKWNGRFRKIHVELARKGYSLSYRRGYFALDNTASANSVEELNAALQPETPESTMLLLRSKVETPLGVVRVSSALDAASLALNPGEDGHRRGRLLVMLVAFPDAPGAAQPDAAAPPQTSAVLNLDFDAALYQGALSNGVAFTQQLKLAPGRYRLRLGVTDLTSHRLGTLDMPVVVSQ